jgi:hypothetical protein
MMEKKNQNAHLREEKPDTNLGWSLELTAHMRYK